MTKRKLHPPRRAHSQNTTFEQLKAMRKAVDIGVISRDQFRQLLQREENRNEWASRVQLRAIAVDLLPIAASQARKGRSRLLAVCGNILLRDSQTEDGSPVGEHKIIFAASAQHQEAIEKGKEDAARNAAKMQEYFGSTDAETTG